VSLAGYRGNPFDLGRTLHEGELRYRYRLSADGPFCSDALVDFWLEIPQPIDRTARSITRRAKLVKAPPHSSDHVIVSRIGPYPGWPRPLDWPRDRTIPPLTIYDVEVFAPVDENINAKTTIRGPTRAAIPLEPKSKSDRIRSVLADLGQKGKLQRVMQPAEIEKLVKPIYEKQWSEKVPSRRHIKRAYDESIK
jgi:hypothetical protein